MASDPKPGEIYAIRPGDNLLLATTRAYGVKAGTPERLRLAQKINAHTYNRRFWRAPGNDFERQNFPDGIVSFGPDFTRDDPQRRAQKGESRSFARIFIPPRDELVHLRLGLGTVLPLNTAPQEQADPPPCTFVDGGCEPTLQPDDSVIVGTDDRLPVADPLSEIPHRWICTVFTCVLDNDGRTWQVTSAGTGVRIGPSHVLTAAHNLYYLATLQHFGVPVFQIVVPTVAAGLVFGRNGRLAPEAGQKTPGPPAISSYGAVLVTRADRFWVPPEWKEAVDRKETPDKNFEMCAYDYGLIRFDGATHCSSVEARGEAPHHWEEKGTSTGFSDRKFWKTLQVGQTLHAAGYPGDKRCTQWKSSGVLKELGSVKPRAKADVNAGKDDDFFDDTRKYAWLMIDSDSVKGMSGGPVWRRVRTSSRSPERLVLTGVVSGHSAATKGGVYVAGLTPFAWDRLRKEMARP